MERRIARAVEERAAAGGADGPVPSRPTPTGRRKSSIPVIEIARAAHKDEALAGLDRWKTRHPEAAAALEPADVLVIRCAGGPPRGPGSG